MFPFLDFEKNTRIVNSITLKCLTPSYTEHGQQAGRRN